ncbi:Ig-like domain-containing protein [Spirosoma gilvum]
MKGRIFYSYLLILLGLIGLTTKTSAQTITSVTVSSPPVCPGNDLTVTFVTSSSFAAGNTFSISLSDVTGNTYPTSLTTISSRTGTSVKVTIPTSSPTSTNYKIRVLSSTGSPVQSLASSAFTINPANKPTVTSPQTGCAGTPTTLIATLSSGGASLAWYNQSKVAIATPSPTASGTYYVSQLNSNGCTSDLVQVDYVANPIPAAPSATTSLSYCQGVNASALTANGSGLKWYTVASGGTGNGTAITPTTSSTGSTPYYVSQTVNGCESARTTITVTIKTSPDKPATSTPPSYCPNETASALVATPSGGATLNWYGTNQNGTASSVATVPNTSSSGTVDYYVSQTLNGCESAKATISVTVKNPPLAPGVSPLSYCVGQSASSLSATPSPGGTLTWYGTASSGGTPSSVSPVPSTSIAGQTTYYVSQKVDGCEGPRAGLTVTVNNIPAAPSATTSLSYCQGVNAPALTASGSGLKWYTTETGGIGNGTAITPTTSSTGSTIYYVSQTVSGCESQRTAITVTTKTTPGTPNTTPPPIYCQNQAATALVATASGGATLNWYGTNQGGTPSSVANTPNTSNFGTINYYVSQTLNSCEGPKATISVTTKPTPGAPGVSPLLACQNRTGYALSATPSDGGTLNWYGTSQSGGTPTANAPALSTSATGSTIYYVSQSVNSCEGPRASITVTVNTVPAPPTINPPGAYCEGTTAAALSASGASLKWYGTNQTGGSPSSAATVPSTDANAIGTKTYYVTQTVNSCESDRIGIPVQVKDTPDAPGTSGIEFCQGYSAPTLTASLVNSATPNWYGTNQSGGTASSSAPTPSNASPGVTVYYVSQTLSGCEGPRASLSVRVKSTPGAPGVSPVSFCNNSQAQQLSANGSGGTTLKWYDASDNSLGGAPTPNTGSVGTQTFKVSQTSNENCEGPKATITVTIKALPGLPSVSNATYCQSQQDQPSQNVVAVSANGQNLRWYNPDGNSYPSAPTPSIDKAGVQEFKVSQTVDGCEGAKATLQVSVVTPAPPSTPKPVVSYCLNDVATPLEATGEAGSKLKWVDPFGRVLDSAVPFTFTPSTDPNGDAFYVYQVASYGCYSARTKVVVRVSAPPTLALVAPTTTVNLGQRAPLQLKFTSVGPFSYTLTGGYTGTSRTTDTTISVLPRGNTIYQIITVANTCGLGLPGNPSTAQINVRVPTVSTSAFTSSTVCSGTSVTVPFTTTGQFNNGNAFRIEVVSAADTSKKYALQNTASGSPVTGTLPTSLPSGQYFVRVNADNPEIGILGSNSPTQLTVRAVASATLTGTQNIYEGTPANLTLAFGGDAPWTATYADSLKSYSVTTGTSPLVLEVRPTQNTTYRLTKVTNFCGSGPISGTATITILPLLGVEDNPLDPLIKTYPVPTDTRLMVELDLPLTHDPATLSLIDANGQPVLQQTTRAKLNELNLSAQPSGLYFLRIQVGDRHTIRKILKQ